MRFLTVADRELRSAARQKATYRTRWVTAALFFGLLVWMLWAFGGFTNRRAAPLVFKVLSVLAFLHCLFLGTARTADSISVERREGTLGLLFLTNLNSAEIIGGKLCSSALASVYGLMAIFPMLALPLLMGGITFGHFARTVAGLLNGILFALAAGFLASVVCKRQFTAIALALGLTVGLGGGSMLGAAAAYSYGPTRPLADLAGGLQPSLHPPCRGGHTGFLDPNRFWLSAAVVAGRVARLPGADDAPARAHLARPAAKSQRVAAARVRAALRRESPPRNVPRCAAACSASTPCSGWPRANRSAPRFSWSWRWS